MSSQLDVKLKEGIIKWGKGKHCNMQIDIAKHLDNFDFWLNVKTQKITIRPKGAESHETLSTPNKSN